MDEKTTAFINKAKIKHKNLYDYKKSVYIHTETPVIIICKKHGEFCQRPHNHLSGNICPECSKENRRIKLINKHGSLIEKHPLLCKEWSNKNKLGPENYISNSRIKVWWNCSKCRHIWESRIEARVKGHGCWKCAVKYRANILLTPTNKSNLLYKFPNICQEWSSKNNSSPDKYNYGSNQKVWWICNQCKIDYFTSIRNRTVSDSGCPRCSRKSKGETIIENYLINNKFLYKKEYRIKECKSKYPLPFDFAIFDENNNLLGLIEYNGIQHYKYKKDGYFSSKVTLEEIKKRDKIKEDYCKNNNIKLLQIPYTKIKEINIFLENFLNEIRHTPK